MKDIITFKKVSKLYKIQHENVKYKSLRDDIINIARHPLSAFSEKSERFYALKDISFSVKPGETLGIIGPNGAGKSTLLKILSRITPPSTGEIRLKGRLASLLEVGTGFHPELTGRENIFLSGAVLGMKQYEIKRKFDEIVEFSGVEKFLDTPVKHFSSGMYTRLAFSVAAHLESDILIVDEVLAVGDVAFQKKCLGKMSDVGKDGRTVIFVSHNMGAIRLLCKESIFINNGKVILKDKTSKVISSYIGKMNNNTFTKQWSNSSYTPQNGTILLKEVRVVDYNKKVLAELTTDDSFFIEIKYYTKHENAFAGFTILLYDSQNNCVFSSISNKEKSWYGKGMPQGIFISTCKIPGKLLNNGWFSLGLVVFSKNFSDSIVVNDIIRFEVSDGNLVRGDYLGGYDGIFRPLLDWETRKINYEK